jgi:hypothetical protein
MIEGFSVGSTDPKRCDKIMQNDNTSKTINSYWDPFGSEEERQAHQEFMRRKLAWMKSPEFDLFVEYNSAYEKAHGII